MSKNSAGANVHHFTEIDNKQIFTLALTLTTHVGSSGAWIRGQSSFVWAAFSIETFGNVLQYFLSLVHDCCGTFANCFDTERSPGFK